MSRDSETESMGMEAATSVFDDLACVAGSLVELPAIDATCLGSSERDGVAERLAAGWNLASFTPTGAALLAVLEVAGATIEVGATEGREHAFDRSTSHGATAAAWGAPPGRRIPAMGLAPGPGGTVVRMSCALVLRVPASALGTPVDVATLLVWHSALHVAERSALPAMGELAKALAVVDGMLDVPRQPRGRVDWARGVVERVRAELGLDDDGADRPLRADPCSASCVK